MAIKKSELYSSLWQSCDELRGGMDAQKPVKILRSNQYFTKMMCCLENFAPTYGSIGSQTAMVFARRKYGF